MRPAYRSRFFFGFVILLAILSNASRAQTTLELSRPTRTWEFLPIVGQRAALFGNETGQMEAWVYPLKILRNLHLLFHVDGRALPAESLARTLTVRPESCTILYASDTFQVRETLFVPVQAQGAVISFEIETDERLDIEVAFQRDFQLEWPAALGGTYISWDAPQRAFYFGEEQKKFAALVGSPTAVLGKEEYATNYSSSSESSFLLGPVLKGKEDRTVVIAGSVQGLADAQQTYEQLSSHYPDLLRQSADYYRKYLDQTVQLQLPDRQLQQAYDWSRVSTIQGLVNNPYLGTGLIAGYRTSSESQRPGFAWFFGRDSLWTSLALNAEGDYATTRTALQFISKYQRADGKIPHEISQAASFVDWFKDFPYPYASADATPLYIIATNDYVMQSGDVAFAREKWDSLWKAYQFLRSTYDTHSLPQNFGFGHGWVEGGPLLPVKTELYQSGLGAEALNALSDLAHLTAKEDISRNLAQEFAQRKAFLNQAFWSADKKLFSFALDRNDKQVETASVLSTVPMWFGVLDEDKSEATLTLLSDSDHQADWGMRIISEHDPKYNPGGYHFGSVWPLFTGWASVGEYRYHRALPAYSNLRSNALLALDGSLGHVTEVLSGDYYQSLSTSSPHQIWSAAMVISPILRGMLGLQVDALNQTITFAPHVPYDWTEFTVKKVHAGNCLLDLTYRRTIDEIILDGKNSGTGQCTLEFSPAASLRATASAELNGKAVSLHMQKNSQDQHATVRVPLSGRANTLRVRLRNDFGLALSSEMPSLGERSAGLRVVSELWSNRFDALTVDLAGRPGHTYELGIWNPTQVSSVDGAKLSNTGTGRGKLSIVFPNGTSEDYVHSKLIIHFAGR
jgi:glycogen debranching enzyme